jgi:pentatricopeptide repeat protein
MDALAKAGRIQDAKLVFDEMKEKSIRSGIFQLLPETNPQSNAFLLF